MRNKSLWRWLVTVALPIAWMTFGVHDRQLCLANVDYANADNTITEANLTWESEPGANNFTFPGGAPSASPVLYGTASSEQTLDVEVTTGGRLGTGAYTYTDDSNIEWGRTPIGKLTAVETVVPNAVFPATYADERARAKTLPDGSIGFVFQRVGTGDAIRFCRRTARETYTTSVAVATFSATPTEDVYPELWWIPVDNAYGSILFVGYFDELDATTQVWKWHSSKDLGATWSAANTTELIVATAGPAEADGVAVVYEPLTRDLIMGFRRNGGAANFYRSVDLGQTWIAQPGLTLADVLQLDIAATCGTIHLAYTESGGTAQYRNKPTSDAASWSTAVQIDTGSPTEAAMTVTPEGWLRVIYGTDTSLTLGTSTDNGASWTTADVTSQGAGHGLVALGVAYSTGQFVVVGGEKAHTGFIEALVFGDESNVQYQWNIAADLADYFAFELPATVDALEYSYTGTSAQSIALDSVGQRVYSIDNTNDTGYVTAQSDEGWVWRIGRDSAGGSTASSDLALRVASPTGISDAIVEIRLDMTNRQAQLYDVAGTSNLGTAVSWAAGDVEFALAVDATVPAASAWYRASTSNQWLPIAVNQTVSTAGAVTYGGRWGKLSASTANIDFQWWRHFTEDGHATNTQEVLPITATGYAPDRLLPGARPQWQGSPLMLGDTWTWSTFSSVGIGRALPTSQTKSASLTWQSGTGSAARSERVVFDLGSSYNGKLSDNLIFVGADNATGVDTIVLQRWDGAAWQTVQTLTLGAAIFGGTVAWTRDSATSVCIRPNGTNGTPRLYKYNELAGLWMSLTDGVDTTMVRIVKHNEGQFTTATGALPLVLEVDAANAITVAGGGWASLAQSSSGAVKVYHSRGMVEGVQASEATRYYAFLITLAPGFTTASIGVLAAGAALPAARPTRQGSSLRMETPYRTTSPTGGAGSAVRRNKRVGARSIELPYDLQLIHRGMYYDGTVVNTGSPDGVAKRVTLDNVPELALSMVRDLGSEMPVFLSIARYLATDWATSAKTSLGDDVIQGFVSNSIDYVAALGDMRSPGLTGAYGGLQLGIKENV